MKLFINSRKYLPLFLALIIFISGFFIGEIFSLKMSSSIVQAQTQLPVKKIHYSEFRKLVFNYLKTHKVPGRGRNSGKMFTLTCTSDPKADVAKLTHCDPNSMVGKLMIQLSRNGYFTTMTKKSNRLAYLDSNIDHRLVLRQHLRDGFERETNYEYYGGNISNKDNHTAYGWFVYYILRDFPIPFDIYRAGDYAVVRALAFDFTDVNELLHLNRNSNGYLTAQITDSMFVPRLREKHEISRDALNEIYNLALFAEFRVNNWVNDPEWHDEEISILAVALQLNKSLIKALKTWQYSSYEEALQAVQGIRYAVDLAITAGSVGAGAGTQNAGRKFGGLGIPRPTKLISPSAYTIKISIESTKTVINGKVLNGGATTLRGEVLSNAKNYILSLARTVEEMSGRRLFDGYKIKINNNLTLAGWPVGGLVDDEAKIIYLSQDKLQSIIILHEFFHVVNPHSRFIIGESIVEYHAKVWSKRLGFDSKPYGSGSAYCDDLIAEIRNRMVQRLKSSNLADQRIDDIFFNPNSQLSDYFGSSFIEDFDDVFENVHQLRARMNMIKEGRLRLSAGETVDMSRRYNLALKEAKQKIQRYDKFQF